MSPGPPSAPHAATTPIRLPPPDPTPPEQSGDPAAERLRATSELSSVADPPAATATPPPAPAAELPAIVTAFRLASEPEPTKTPPPASAEEFSATVALIASSALSPASAIPPPSASLRVATDARLAQADPRVDGRDAADRAGVVDDRSSARG